MRHLASLLLFFALTTSGTAQCSALNIAVSASDTGYVQLYHPGFFMFGSTANDGGFGNQCHWTVTTMDGEAVFDTLTTGAWADQSFALFDHGLSVQDSMLVELILTHPEEPMDCCMADTLIWVEDDFFNFGSWETASLNLGADCSGLLAVEEAAPEVAVYPQPARAVFRVRLPADATRLVLTGADGRTWAEFPVVASAAEYPLTGVPTGLYVVNAWNARGELVAVTRLMKVPD